MKAFFFCCALLLAPVLQAATEYEPSEGQPGKDVEWVPTPYTLITKMLQMAELTPKDYLMDLGSGDGRIPIQAAKEFGATALGIEYNPDLVALSNRDARIARVSHKVKFIEADIYQTDLSKATVITMYLMPSINLELRPKLLALKPGTRIVTHAFDMGDWQHDRQVSAEERHAYLWIVPAQVGGDWRVDLGKQTLELSLAQKYQMLSGTARVGADAYQITEGRVEGEEVHLMMNGPTGKREFNGRLRNGRLSGSLR